MSVKITTRLFISTMSTTCIVIQYEKLKACFVFRCFQEDAKKDALEALSSDVLNKQLLMNVEYKSSSGDCVSLLTPEKEDIALGLVSEGLILVENRKEKRLAKLVSDYRSAQDRAKSARVSCLSSDNWTFFYARRTHSICTLTPWLCVVMWLKSMTSNTAVSAYILFPLK